MIPKDLSIYNKYLIAFYNKQTGKDIIDIHQIPEESLTFLLLIRYEDIIRDYVKQDRIKKLSLRFISTRYGVGVRVIRTIVSNGTQ